MNLCAPPFLAARVAIGRMTERSSPAEVIEIANAGLRVWKWRRSMRDRVFLFFLALVFVCSLYAQPARPVGQPPPPTAIYTPKPTYRAEWAKQGLTGKGVVLVNIDKQTGQVSGARMLTSTGNQQLDGAALQAYSQWRFDPRTVAVSQLQIPIEFAKPPPAAPKAAKSRLPQPVIFLIVPAIAAAALAFLKKRRA
jgi:TonB family protein